MKSITEKKKQWMWFAALWGGGLAATALLAYTIRWVVFH